MASAGETCDNAVPDVERTVAPTPVAAPTPAAAPVLTKSRLLTAFSPWGFRSFGSLFGFLAMRLPRWKAPGKPANARRSLHPSAGSRLLNPQDDGHTCRCVR